MIVGLTGGIGSGKTTVLNLFKKLGVPVYIADLEAKKIMNTSKLVERKIIALLGKEAYEGGVLNKNYIASKIFGDQTLLKGINNIVHPEVHKNLQLFAQNNSSSQYIIYESAILFENNNQNLCNKIIVVTAPKEERIKRVIKRDNVNKEQVIARMNSQLPQELKIKNSDFVIENNLGLDLEQKVLDIHKKITS